MSSLGPEKMVVISNSGTVALSEPTTIYMIYIGENLGPGISDRNLQMVLLSDRNFTVHLCFAF